MTSPRLTIIAPAAAHPATGLNAAADAFQSAGLTDQLANLGITVASTDRPAGTTLPDPIAALAASNAAIASSVAAAGNANTLPVLTGGTCGYLPGMVAGLQQTLGPGTTLGLLWLDAHGDFNTPRTTPSGMLGGMPVAVVAGLCHAEWREGAGMTAPIPTNRIMMVDVRNLDPEEEQLIRATDVQIVRLHESDAHERIAAFAESVDALYIHIDADILDASLQPNHPTVESDGLDVAETLSIVETACRHGKLVAFAVVSVNPEGPGGSNSLQSGLALLTGGLQIWASQNFTV